MQPRKRTFLKVVGALAATPFALRAFAQAGYPNKPIKIIAPVQPGGGVDLVARTIAERLGKALDQAIIVENQSGGGGVIASLATARAAPDGYTLMVGYVGTHGTNPAVRKLPYDAVKDFTQYVKANPGKLSYGSSGPGTLTHLAMEQLKVAADLDMQHVPYRGIGPAITDILGGQTQALFPGLAAALPHIKAGKMKPLAIIGPRRDRLVPDVPTFEESGYAGFDGVQWYGIVGPANMPAPLVKRLNEQINKLLESPALRQRLSGEALEPMPMSPEQFGQYIRDDIARWSRLAKARNIEITE